MTSSALGDALDDVELDRLSAFLDGAGPSAMNLEALDGYFTALICAPQDVSPADYLPEIWGASFSFATPRKADAILELLMRHWNSIVDELAYSLEVEPVYAPLLFEDEAGEVHASDWANGFMTCLDMLDDDWEESDTELANTLSAIRRLAEGEQDGHALDTARREALLDQMITGLPALYGRHGAARATAVAQPRRREAPKVGRNDPCPCGSARKFKQCCGKG